MTILREVQIGLCALASTGVGALAFSAYWLLVCRLNRVRWSRLRSKEELRLTVGRRGYLRVAAGWFLFQMVNQSLMDWLVPRAAIGRGLTSIAWHVPGALIIAAIIGGMICIGTNARLGENLPPKPPAKE